MVCAREWVVDTLRSFTEAEVKEEITREILGRHLKRVGQSKQLGLEDMTNEAESVSIRQSFQCLSGSVEGRRGEREFIYVGRGRGGGI